MFPEFRDFQKQAHIALQQGFLAGHRQQIVCAPTGSGKTVIGLYLCDQAVKKYKRAMFVCDRTALIDQTVARAWDYGMRDLGVIRGGDARFRPYERFQVGSIQTLARRKWPDVDLVVVDECHTQYETVRKFIEANRNVTVIGLSATPFSPGLGRYYTNLVNAGTMFDLTKQGILVPMRVRTCVRPDMANVKLNTKGEWDENETAQRGMAIIGDVVAEWMAHAENRKTIIFGSTIKHCEEIVRRFNQAGVMAALYTQKTGEDERKTLLAEFSKPNSMVRILASVEALAKGFDVPDVGCVVDCRPLRKSLSTAIQMWGRGLRSSPATGKQDCLLIDHSGNIIRFAEDLETVFHDGVTTLDDGQELDKKVRKLDEKEDSGKGCPKCGFKPFVKRCNSCGFELVVQPTTIEHEHGASVEFATGATRESKQHFYSELLWLQRSHGFKTGWIAHQYHNKFGVWPRGMKDEPRIASVDTRNWIKSQTLRYRKSAKFKQAQVQFVGELRGEGVAA